MKVESNKIYIVVREKAFGENISRIFSNLELAKQYINYVKIKSPYNAQFLKIQEHNCITNITVDSPVEKVLGPDFDTIKNTYTSITL